MLAERMHAFGSRSGSSRTAQDADSLVREGDRHDSATASGG
jgi:hypothetical protein